MEGRARITRSLPWVPIEPAAVILCAFTHAFAVDGRSPSGRMVMRRLVHAAGLATAAAIVVRILYIRGRGLRSFGEQRDAD